MSTKDDILALFLGTPVVDCVAHEEFKKNINIVDIAHYTETPVLLGYTST
jgi:hypothetical protein